MGGSSISLDKNEEDSCRSPVKSIMSKLNLSIGKLFNSFEPDILKDMANNDIRIVDGFQIPLKLEHKMRLSQTYLEKT